jgi:hypothetical protein
LYGFRKIFILSGVFILALFSSCQNDSIWYPSASVTVHSKEEIIAPATMMKSLLLTLVIHNDGNTSIINSTVTILVKTNAREYLQTVSSTIKIIPGGKIALAVSFNFIDAAETLQADGVTVYDSFFE